MSTTTQTMTRKEARRAELIAQAIKEANGLPTTGFICKECGLPSPVGVGYASMAPEQTDVDACPCGYSVKPVAA